MAEQLIVAEGQVPPSHVTPIGMLSQIVPQHPSPLTQSLFELHDVLQVPASPQTRPPVQAPGAMALHEPAPVQDPA